MEKVGDWLRDFANENRLLCFTIFILTIGAIPLYVYSLSIGQLPDFSLADLTGVLIASFMTEIFIGAVIVFYLLAAGLATRATVGMFYPEKSMELPLSSGPASDAVNREYLFRGHFIVGVTMMWLLVWFGISTKPFSAFLGSDYSWMAKCSYYFSLACIFFLMIVDWRCGWRRGKYLLAGVFFLATTFLAILMLAYEYGFMSTMTAVAPGAVSSSPNEPFPKLSNWTQGALVWLFQKHLVVVAVCISIVIGVSLPAIAWRFRSRPHSHEKPKSSWLNHWPSGKIFFAKIAASLAFGVSSLLVILFFGLVVGEGELHWQMLTAFTGGCYVILLNWAAFQARDRKIRLLIAAAMFVLIFILIPVQSRNSTFFPKVIVRALGFGNMHADSVALSSAQCATLAPYGVRCASRKDMAITLTNVNILNRIGSTVLLELQAKRILLSSASNILPSSGKAMNSLQMTVSDGEVKTLAISEEPDAGAKSKDTGAYSCDYLMLDHLHTTDPTKANALACIKLSVPKDQVMGYTINGSRTYAGEYSQYVAAPKPLHENIDE